MELIIDTRVLRTHWTSIFLSRITHLSISPTSQYTYWLQAMIM